MSTKNSQEIRSKQNNDSLLNSPITDHQMGYYKAIKMEKKILAIM